MATVESNILQERSPELEHSNAGIARDMADSYLAAQGGTSTKVPDGVYLVEAFYSESYDMIGYPGNFGKKSFLHFILRGLDDASHTEHLMMPCDTRVERRIQMAASTQRTCEQERLVRIIGGRIRTDRDMMTFLRVIRF